MFEGSFHLGKMEGKGKKTNVDGSVYEGDFKDNREDGKGVCNWPDGRNYEGDFVLGK